MLPIMPSGYNQTDESDGYGGFPRIGRTNAGTKRQILSTIRMTPNHVNPVQFFTIHWQRLMRLIFFVFYAL